MPVGKYRTVRRKLALLSLRVDVDGVDGERTTEREKERERNVRCDVRPAQKHSGSPLASTKFGLGLVVLYSVGRRTGVYSTR